MWNQGVQDAVDSAIAQAGSHERPVAVSDFDNTCIQNDIGELFAHYLVEEMLYRFDLDEFWELIDPRDGRDLIRELTMKAQDVPVSERETSAVFQAYVAELGAVYGRRLAREGKRDCYAWAVRLHIGMSESDMLKHSEAAIRKELKYPLETMTLTTQDGESIDTARGVRIFQEIKTTFERFQAAGMEVWLVSASNKWTIQAFASFFGIPQNHVIGNAVEVEDGILTDRLIMPALHHEGKVGVIERDVGVRPLIGFGDSRSDWNMLEFAERAVLIDTGDVSTAADAEANQWAIQRQNSLTYVP